MNNTDLKKAIISILVGAGVMMLANILQGLLNLLLDYKDNLIPAASGMVYYLKQWKPIA